MNRAVLAPLLLTSGCFLAGGTGSADIEGSVGAHSFDFNTVFAWIDAKEPDIDDGKLTFKNRESPILEVRMLGSSFDPTVDQRFASVEDQFIAAQDNALLGALSMTVTNIDRVSDGESVEIPRTGSGSDPRLVLSFEFGAIELDGDATYPGDVEPAGSRFAAKLTLDEVGREPGDSVSGTLVLNFDRADDDPAGARTGNVSIEFDAEVVGERIAECNTSNNFAFCEIERPEGR